MVVTFILSTAKSQYRRTFLFYLRRSMYQLNVLILKSSPRYCLPKAHILISIVDKEAFLRLSSISVPHRTFFLGIIEECLYGTLLKPIF